MRLDVSTVIACSAAVLALLGASLLLSWAGSGRPRRLWWWALPFLFAVTSAALLVGDGFLVRAWQERFAVAAALLAHGFAWQAARAFDRRTNVVAPAMLAVAGWFGVDVAASALGAPAVGGVLRTLCVAAFNGLVALEFWRGRDEPLPSRRLIVALMAAFAGLSLLRAPFVPFLPAPLGLVAPEVWAVVIYNAAVVAQASATVALVVAMSRERVALANYEMALRDHLTGALNRRAFDQELLMLESERCSEAAGVAALVFDIDSFKTINDRYGHVVGDVVIVAAATAAQRSIRSRDALFRIGGEEFVCLLPGATLAQAEMVAERLRRSFASTPIRVGDDLVWATMSVGVSSTEIACAHVAEIVSFADEAMYAAKEAGRNRTIVSDRPRNRRAAGVRQLARSKVIRASPYARASSGSKPSGMAVSASVASSQTISALGASQPPSRAEDSARSPRPVP